MSKQSGNEWRAQVHMSKQSGNVWPGPGALWANSQGTCAPALVRGLYVARGALTPEAQVRPARYCSPRHRMPLNSRNEGPTRGACGVRLRACFVKPC